MLKIKGKMNTYFVVPFAQSSFATDARPSNEHLQTLNCECYFLSHHLYRVYYRAGAADDRQLLALPIEQSNPRKFSVNIVLNKFILDPIELFAVLLS